MEILNEINAYPFKNQNSTVTIGSFDGVHLGHQRVLQDLKQKAHQTGAKSVVISFEPHPRIYFDPHTDLRLLNTTAEKIDLLAQQGIDSLILQKFDQNFAAQSPEKFIQKLVKNLNMKDLLIGYDHRFGKDRQGSYDFIRSLEDKYHFKTHKIEPVMQNNLDLSSTIIRQALKAGQVELAQQYLGYPYFLTGLVVKGHQLGRQLGFPTANIEVQDSHKLIPKQGVYIVKSLIDGHPVYGMMNIGVRPTINGKKQILEIHFFDFNQDLYGRQIPVYFLKRLRDEKKFPNLEALKNQLQKDAGQARKILNL